MDSPTLDLDEATLAANGGAGGGGTSTAGQSEGEKGQDGQPGLARAEGGHNGGAGGARSNRAGNAGSPTFGGPYFEERSNEPYLPEQVVWGLTLGQRGPRGKRTDIWWLSTGPVNTGDTFPAGVTRQFVAVGNFVIPHDGSVPITG